MKLGKGLTLNDVRRTAYTVARTAGDVQAVKRHRVPQRAYNRALSRITWRALKGWLR